MIRPEKQLILGILLSLLLFVPHAPVSASQAIEGNIDDIARTLQTYFPKVTGKVSDIASETLTIKIDNDMQLTKGIVLKVFRKGSDFQHPVTDVTLGHFEDEVAEVEVLSVSEKELLAKIITEGSVKKGDLVRIPASKIALAIGTRSEQDHAFLMNELAAALKETGRFKVQTLQPGTNYQDAFKQKQDYFVALKTRQDGKKFSISLELKNTTTGTSLAELEVLIHQSEDSDLILEHLQYQLFKQRQNP